MRKKRAGNGRYVAAVDHMRTQVLYACTAVDAAGSRDAPAADADLQLLLPMPGDANNKAPETKVSACAAAAAHWDNDGHAG